MESVKKILPYLLIAVVFAIVGYFIGHSSLENQAASLYKINSRASTKDQNISSKGPTGGDTAGILVWENGKCNIYRGFDWIGTAVGFLEKDCHNLKEVPKDMINIVLKTPSTTSVQNVKKETGSGVSNILVWSDGLGCIYLTLDGRWSQTNINKDMCYGAVKDNNSAATNKN